MHEYCIITCVCTVHMLNQILQLLLSAMYISWQNLCLYTHTYLVMVTQETAVHLWVAGESHSYNIVQSNPLACVTCTMNA